MRVLQSVKGVLGGRAASRLDIYDKPVLIGRSAGDRDSGKRRLKDKQSISSPQPPNAGQTEGCQTHVGLAVTITSPAGGTDLILRRASRLVSGEQSNGQATPSDSQILGNILPHNGISLSQHDPHTTPKVR